MVTIKIFEDRVTVEWREGSGGFEVNRGLVCTPDEVTWELCDPSEQSPMLFSHKFIFRTLYTKCRVEERRKR